MRHLLNGGNSPGGGHQVGPANHNMGINEGVSPSLKARTEGAAELNSNRATRRAKCNSGKLFLAAIVHYDSLKQANCDENGAASNETAAASEAERRVAVAGGQQQALEKQTTSTNEPPASNRSRPLAGKLARLFSLRAGPRAGPAAERASPRSKIDGPAGGEKCETEARGGGSIMMDRLQASAESGVSSSPCGSTSGTTSTPECQLVGEQQQQQQQRQSNQSKQQLVHQLDRGQRRSNAIEFKFDLIVEGDDVAQRPQKGGSGGAGEEELGEGEEEERGEGEAERILRPIKQRKLLDQVDELVESFVLDSMDVCLLNAGRRRRRRLVHGQQSGHADQLDYALQLAELTLTYAFQLLQASRERPAHPGYLPEGAADARAPLMIDDFSLHLEATLFAEARGSDELLAISDLLASEPEKAALVIGSGGSTSNQSLECRTIGQALAALQLVRLNLMRGPAPSGLLMLGVKLKRLINGGLFTNRLCLIDLAEPAHCQLAPMFEFIFNGQALARLKRQKAHLRALEMQLELMERMGRNEEALQVAAGEAVETAECQAKHHQLASLTRLIQAEWLIYKQLSAALIRSLVVVHCHKLSAAPAEPAAPGSAEMVALMEYNLNLLEFARSIQRASQGRLRRRRRHLKRHLSSATNLSFVSDTNLSTTNFTDDTDDDEALNYVARQSKPSDFAGRASPNSVRHQRDLMISTPFRRRATDWTRRGRGLQPTCLDCSLGLADEDEDNDADWQSSQQDLSAATTDNFFNCSRLAATAAAHRQQERDNSNQLHLALSAGCRHGHGHRRDRYHRHHHHQQRWRRRHHHHHQQLADCERHRHCDSTRARNLALEGANSRARAASLTRHFWPTEDELDELSLDARSQDAALGRQLGSAAALAASQQQARRRGHAAELTGSSSLSISSGCRRRRTSAAASPSCGDATAAAGPMPGALPAPTSLVAYLINHQRGLNQQPVAASQSSMVQQQLASNPSETEDSLASATLNSCSSQSLRERQRAAELGAKVFKVMQSRSAREDDARGLKLQVAPRQQPAIELQPFCGPSKGASQREAPNAGTAPNQCSANEPAPEDQLDNASDICSVVAEPPKQLKLEQFLNQFSSAIVPPAGMDKQQFTQPTCAIGPAERGADDDEDEDCKSHSSILDHLSSLTMESSFRLRPPPPSADQTPCGFDEEAEPAQGLRVNIVDDCNSRPVGGHLQQLLKSTLQMQANTDRRQACKLRALTVDCEAKRSSPGLGQQSQDRVGLAQSANGAPGNLQPSTFTPTSTDSCASAGSSSASSSGGQPEGAGQPAMVPQHQAGLSLNQLYSSVIRQQT